MLLMKSTWIVNHGRYTVFFQFCLHNISFICILNQAPLDRQELAPILNLSEQQLDYITDQPPGYGLIYNGSTVVPFENSIDESTEIFKLIDSRKKDKKNETI